MSLQDQIDQLVQRVSTLEVVLKNITLDNSNIKKPPSNVIDSVDDTKVIKNKKTTKTVAIKSVSGINIKERNRVKKIFMDNIKKHYTKFHDEEIKEGILTWALTDEIIDKINTESNTKPIPNKPLAKSRLDNISRLIANEYFTNDKDLSDNPSEFINYWNDNSEHKLVMSEQSVKEVKKEDDDIAELSE